MNKSSFKVDNLLFFYYFDLYNIHNFISRGVNAIIGDYLFRPLVPLTKLAWGMTCVISFAGLMYLNVHDVGICKSVTMVMNL